MERELPPEIKDYKEGRLLGLPMRQSVGVVLTLVLSAGTYFPLMNKNRVLAIVACVLVALVPAVICFMSFNGLTAFKMFRVIIRNFVKSPSIRKWQSENFDYAYLQGDDPNTTPEVKQEYPGEKLSKYSGKKPRKEKKKKNKKKLKTEAKIPKSVQETIPIQRVSHDGILSPEDGLFVCIWKFQDINYTTEDEDTQKNILIGYANLLTKIDDSMQIQLTFTNRYIDENEYRDTVLIPFREDGLNFYREEFNSIFKNEAALTNNLVKERYICLTAKRKNFDDARKAFSHVNLEMAKSFKYLGSDLHLCSLFECLRIYHNFFRVGEEKYFRFDFSHAVRQGMSFKDFIAPDFLQFTVSPMNYFCMGERFGRVLFANDFGTMPRDTLIKDLMDREQNLMLSIHIEKLTKDQSMKFVQRQMDAVETDIEKNGQKQRQKNNFSGYIPYKKRKIRDAVNWYMDEITKNDQRLMFVTLVIAVTADTEDELNAVTQDLIATAAAHSCDLRKLFFQQEEGLCTVLPAGINKLSMQRTMITEVVAILQPFQVKDMSHPNGLWKGHHPGTKKQIFVDRKRLMNGNGFYLGKSGAGKSFAVKEEIALVALMTSDDIIVVDVDREYTDAIQEMGGEVIYFSPSADTKINAMELVGVGTIEEQIKSKSDYIQSLVVQARNAELQGGERSIIDRCVQNVFNRYFDRKRSGEDPETVVLQHFYNELLAQPEDIAKHLALDLEIFVLGSLNIFASETNVNMNNRITCFDIHDIPRSLMGVAILAILDFIDNRVTINRANKKYTYVLIDEIQEPMAHQSGADYIRYSWQHIRKMGGLATGATQNASVLLNSPIGKVLLANSEIVVLLAQHQTDLELLISILNLSDSEIKHLEMDIPGQGVLKVGKDIIPFVNELPEDSALFKLMDTRPVS